MLLRPRRRVTQPQGLVGPADKYVRVVARLALPGQSLLDLSTGVAAQTTGAFSDPAVFVSSLGQERQVHPSAGVLGAQRWFWPPGDGISDNATLIFAGHPQNYSNANGHLINRGRDGAGSGWNLSLRYESGSSLVAGCVTGSPVAGFSATLGSLALSVGDEQRCALVKRGGSISVYDWRSRRSATATFAGTGLRSSTEGISVGSSLSAAGAAHHRHALNAALAVALPDEEVWSILDNPWQLFRPLPARLLVDLSGPVSISRPGGGTELGAWTSTDATLWQAIGETTPNDATFITSPELQASAQATPLIALTAPVAAGVLSVRLRAQRTLASGQLRVVLTTADGTPVGASAWQVLGSSYALYTLPASTTGTSTHFRIEARL